MSRKKRGGQAAGRRAAGRRLADGRWWRIFRRFGLEEGRHIGLEEGRPRLSLEGGRPRLSLEEGWRVGQVIWKGKKSWLEENQNSKIHDLLS